MATFIYISLFSLAVDKRKILAGMKMIMDMTAVDGERSIKFIQRTTEANFVNVISDINKGCFSMIGMIGGPQVLSLAPGCLTTDTVAHEFIHALGIKFFFILSII